MRIFPLLFLLLAAAPSAAAPQEVRLSVLPARPLVERGKSDQLLNFDFLIENATGEKLDVSTIEVTVLAPGDVLVSQRRVGTNGDTVQVVPNRTIEPGGRLVVFNPFYSFAPDLDLATLRYEFVFDAPDKPEKYRARVVVKPLVYETKAELILPARGRLFVHDGHDFYSHHRRLDITGGMTTALGITSNFMRYSYDFCVVDEAGRMYKGTGESNEDWYGFGTPIHAPASGKVVAAANTIPDNSAKKRVEFSREEVMKNVRLLFGNYVVIDHGNGEFSFMAHMKQGSVRVAVGQIVNQGEQVGEMGFSGDAFLVHLHYQLQSDAGFGEGLPSYFRDFKRTVGATSVPVARGQVDSGDVVESTAGAR
jgi:murein DD-endopeptidase MepM/ murein hydrolase activator NlpD